MVDINKVQLPADKDLAKQVLQAHQDTRSKEIEGGVLGMFFGFAAEKAGNIAGFAMSIAFIALVCVLVWMPDGASFTKKDAVIVFGGVITSALGFLFGRSSTS